MKRYRCPIDSKHRLVFDQIITVGVSPNTHSEIQFYCLGCKKKILLEYPEMTYLPRRATELKRDYPEQVEGEGNPS